MAFIGEYQLFDRETPLLVAVSGGVDSMALLYSVSQIERYGYSNSIRVVHLNHGTRPGQIDEAELVRKYCEVLDIDFQTHLLSDLNPEKNFEYKARLKRYELLHDISLPNEKILLAHHIDDSFEWTMLQSLRSSSIDGLIGIPVFNGSIIRPFMCVTKAQIIRFARCFDLPFLEDPTNEQIKYERNFIRNDVIPVFAPRYKKFLKHYVYRHNEIARQLGVHRVFSHKTHFQINLNVESVLIYSLQMREDYSGIGELVKNAMKKLNPDSRGTLSIQIKKIKEALKNNKHGPLTLTNGVKVYLDYQTLLLTKKSSPLLAKKFDDFKTFSYDEFYHYLEDWLSSKFQHLDFPFIVLVKYSSFKKRNFYNSFNPNLIQGLKENHEEFYPALRLLREWSKKRNRHKVLRLNFLSQI